MEIKELKNKSNSDLHALLSQKRESVRELRFKDANKQLKDVRDIREAKKDIAKILTLLNRNHDTTTVKQEEKINK